MPRIGAELENRCLVFAADVRALLKLVPTSVSNTEDAKQLARSSGSVGANYIEANESLGRKDFVMRARIARKEARESEFWLKLITVRAEQEPERVRLADESRQLAKILGAILRKVSTDL